MKRRTFLRALPLVLGTACRARIGADAPVARPAGTLRVVTLNLAHGRARAAVQSRARRPDFYRDNLEVVAEVLRREQPDVVALQEAEIGSRWAGGFDHVEYLAERTGLAHLHVTAHMNEPPRFCYGTALLSRHPLHDPTGGTFDTPARWRKGWTAATIQSPIESVRVVSVHLDFARAAHRHAEAAVLTRRLQGVSQPLVIAGDLNCDAADPTTAASTLLDVLQLRTHVETKRRPATYVPTARRLDWVLFSDPFVLERHSVLTEDVLSDHRAVVVDLSVEP